MPYFTEDAEPTTGECVVREDKYIYQFDADRNDESQEIKFTNVCHYSMVSTRCGAPSDVPLFVVNAIFDRVPNNDKKSYVKAVFVRAIECGRNVM